MSRDLITPEVLNLIDACPVDLWPYLAAMLLKQHPTWYGLFDEDGNITGVRVAQIEKKK